MQRNMRNAVSKFLLTCARVSNCLTGRTALLVTQAINALPSNRIEQTAGASIGPINWNAPAKTYDNSMEHTRKSVGLPVSLF
jgi:hypothetical protein